MLISNNKIFSSEDACGDFIAGLTGNIGDYYLVKYL
jgi:hypothetical protein